VDDRQPDLDDQRHGVELSRQQRHSQSASDVALAVSERRARGMASRPRSSSPRRKVWTATRTSHHAWGWRTTCSATAGRR
jgi:hypothetical protein